MDNVEISVAVLQRILDDAAYIKQEDRQAIRDAIASKSGGSDKPAESSLKAETRIEELEDMLRWYVEEDEIHEGDPENLYWIDGKHKAMKLLGMEVE